MEKTQKENNTLYILKSKTNIDTFIRCNDYKKAFTLFVIVLEKLHDNDKDKFIYYYSKKLV
jgi:hypothetical protein